MKDVEGQFTQGRWSLPMGLVVVAVAAACSAAAQEVTITAKEFEFVPRRVTLDRPGEVTFVITTKGEFPHGFKLDGVSGGLARIEPGETREVSFSLQKGSYTTYCPLRGHRERGMEGTLAVGAEAAPKAAPAPRPAPPPGYY